MRIDTMLARAGASLLLMVVPFVAPRGAHAAPPTAARPTPSADQAKPTPPAPTPPTAKDGPTHAVQLRDLDQRIDELAEQVRRSRRQISVLSDRLVIGGDAGSRATVRFTNELSRAFQVTRVVVVLDGAVQYNKTDQAGELADQKEIPIFDGSVPPGDHTVQILVNVQGSGFGVFSYLRGFRYEVRSFHSFTAVEGKTVSLDAVAFEKGNATTPYEDRLTVRYGETVSAGTSGDAASK